MKFCVHIFVLVCTVAYVQCISTPNSTGPITSPTQPTQAATNKPVTNSTTTPTLTTIKKKPANRPTTKASPSALHPQTSKPSNATQTKLTPATSPDKGFGNGSPQIVKPFGPMILGAAIIVAMISL